MPISLHSMTKESFRQDVPPDEQADQVSIGPCKWSLKARVSIRNEPGKRFRVGFVQAQYVNVVEATYARTLYREVPIHALPILDGSRREPPFYHKRIDKVPKVDGLVGNLLVDTELWDQPEPDLLWYHEGDHTNPLETVTIHLRFETWLAVQDVTSARPRRAFAALLKQWDVVVRRTYTVNVARPAGNRMTVTSTNCSFTPVATIEQPPACVWVGQTANYNFRDEFAARPVRLPAPIVVPATPAQVRSRTSRVIGGLRSIVTSPRRLFPR